MNFPDAKVKEESDIQVKNETEESDSAEYIPSKRDNSTSSQQKENEPKRKKPKKSHRDEDKPYLSDEGSEAQQQQQAPPLPPPNPSAPQPRPELVAEYARLQQELETTTEALNSAKIQNTQLKQEQVRKDMELAELRRMKAELDKIKSADQG